MTSKAISKKYKCNPCKVGIDRNPYVQVDIDRLLGHLKSEVEREKEILANHVGTVYEDFPHLLLELKRQIDFNEGLIGMIEANSFR